MKAACFYAKVTVQDRLYEKLTRSSFYSRLHKNNQSWDALGQFTQDSNDYLYKVGDYTCP